MVEMGLIEERWKLTPRDAPAWNSIENKADMSLRMAVYAAQIDRMDQNIGRVLAKIKAIGAESNTLVLFLSDNGGCAEPVNRSAPGVPPGPKESFLSYGQSWANLSNTPFFLYKHWVHEGGIATPLIAYWPSHIPSGGGFNHQVGHVIDIMPTCLDAAGAAYPKTFGGNAIPPEEGMSLLGALNGKTLPERTLYWEHEGNRAVRQGKWKLVCRASRGKTWELYDMEASRSETDDLAGQNPQKVQELSALYDAWAQRCNVIVKPASKK